jgi:ATP-dependent DNA helicase RecG
MARAPHLSDWPDRLAEDAFWELAGKLETSQLDFKTGPPQDLSADIAAFAMTDGGLFVLGVSEDRELTGCHMSQKIHDKIYRSSHECGVDVQVREIQVGSKKVTLIAVPEVRGRIVTTPNGRLLRRVGSDNQPLVGDALARFVRERTEQPAEEEAIQSFDPSTIDLRFVNRALRADGRQTVRREGLVRGLIDLGVALPQSAPADPAVMKAAVLLFSRPANHASLPKIQIVRRQGVGPGPGPAKARKELEGNIPDLVNRTLSEISSLTNHYLVVVGAQREVWPEYPETVLREAVLNALAHRDYGLVGATVDVEIWDDRIEIQSPGPLPGHITLDNIRDEHYSRNPKVMHCLKLLGLVEEFGEGVDRMFREMEARLMEPPIFSVTSSSVTVTLRNRFLVDVEQQAWLALLGHYELGPLERRVLIAARTFDGGVTPRRLRDMLGDAPIQGLLAGLVAKGLLVRVGERGGSRYILSDEVVMRAGASGLEARNRKRQMLLDEMRRRGGVTTAQASQLLGEEMGFARDLLNDLVQAGLARAYGNTRARRYYPI